MKEFLGALILLASWGYEPLVVAQGPIIICPGTTIGPRPKSEKRPKLLEIGETAPDWKLTDASGKTHSLSEYRGRVVVLDFWATWCVPCSMVMPRMQKLHEKFFERGVLVFGVNSWESSDPLALMRKSATAMNYCSGGRKLPSFTK